MEQEELTYKEKVYELGLVTNEALKILFNNPGEYKDSHVMAALWRKYEELQLDIDNQTQSKSKRDSCS